MPALKIELIQQILLTLEDALPDWRGIDLGIEDDQLRSYYVDFLRRDGLVEAKNWGTDQTGDDWKATRLTPDGHRMAEALRTASENWRERAKESGHADGRSLTWEMAKRHLSQSANAKQQEWDVFVSYASEDRESVARPLATILRAKYGLRVWYDEIELRVGDSLRRKIDDGLKGCRFGVVILSKSYFGKRYPESELSGLDQREQDDGKVILPVWHEVDVADVRRHSPRLADRVALKWQDGVERVATRLLEVIAPDLHRAAIDREQELTEYANRTRVPRVTTGEELTTLLGTYGFFFFNDALRDQAVDLVGGFQQEVFEWSEIWDELGPRQRAEVASGLTQKLEELHALGWTVHARIEPRQNSLGGKLVDWPLTVVVVVHGTPQTVNFVSGDRIVILRDDGSRQTMRQ